MEFMAVSIASCMIIKILYRNCSLMKDDSITILLNVIPMLSTTNINVQSGVQHVMVSIVLLHHFNFPLSSKSATGSILKIWEHIPFVPPHTSTVDSGPVKFSTLIVSLVLLIYCNKR